MFITLVRREKNRVVCMSARLSARLFVQQVYLLWVSLTVFLVAFVLFNVLVNLRLSLSCRYPFIWYYDNLYKVTLNTLLVINFTYQECFRPKKKQTNKKTNQKLFSLHVNKIESYSPVQWCFCTSTKYFLNLWSPFVLF